MIGSKMHKDPFQRLILMKIHDQGIMMKRQGYIAQGRVTLFYWLRKPYTGGE